MTEHGHSPDPRELRILILAPTGRDATLTADLLRRCSVDSEICPDVTHLCLQLLEGAGAAILAEEAMGSESIRTLTDVLGAAPAWSDLPLIVLTGRGGVDETQRVLSALGTRVNLTLLERPVRTVTLRSAVSSALRARRRQYQVRDLLQRLQVAVQERDRFLAILSHELRNPLATILSALALIDQEPAADLEQRQVIARQARQLARLVDDLLDVSRVTAGKITLQRRPVDLRDVARNSLQAVQVAARAHHLSYLPPPAPVLVLGDSHRLEQVLTNLLHNAIKYTPPAGHIGVELAADGTSAFLRVRDDGIGIAPQSLPQLFSPFMQVDNSLDRSQGGLGLGLSLVKALVEMQGGRVTAESPGLGRGSVFTVSLPLASPAHVPAPQPAANGSAPAAEESDRPRRILLVEDRPEARLVMQRLLASWGHHVETAEDGPQGVHKAIELRPEVALVDIGLPGLSGFDVARQIRRHLHQSIFLVALTGYGQPEDRQRTREAGFDLHLVKPVEPEDLQRLLRNVAAPERTAN